MTAFGRGFSTIKNLKANLKGKKHSSQLWLTRQMKDPYVEMAKRENYRCRSAFKLLEINERFNILKPGQTVIDCGAAPGSWTQVAVQKTNANDAMFDAKVGTVIAIDKQSICPIEGATILNKMDFIKPNSQTELLKLLEHRNADVVLSDMAPNSTGVRELDHDNIVKLVYAALMFAVRVTKIDGTFLCKIWDGRQSQQIQQDLLQVYTIVKHVRPRATRDDSTELFFLARGFKGIKK